MIGQRITFVASTTVVLTGALWGLYWVPVRELSGMGIAGPWGTVAITLMATLLLAAFAFTHRRRLFEANRLAVASIAISGGAVATYSVAVVQGRVAIIMILFFLTPVWSVVIGQVFLGRRASRLRMLAIAIGVIGLTVMLGAGGTLPLPKDAGEWLALFAGFLWSVGTTGMHARSDIKPIAAAFVFVLGAAAAALLLASILAPLPDGFALADHGKALALAFGTAGVWWCLCIPWLIWATLHLDPARVGILLMTEVLVGTVSAAIFAGEHLDTVEMIGGALVVCAGLIEVWPETNAVAEHTS